MRVFGALFGMLLIAGSGYGLFWNEGRAVTTARSLAEGAGQVISVEIDRVAPENEGRLVHVAGALTTKARLSDPEFGVSSPGALLVRKVEMYQWAEEKQQQSGSEDRTPSYYGTWSSSRIDSTRFKSPGRANPQMRYRELRIAAKDASLGAFRPGETVLRKLSATAPVTVEPALAGRIRAQIAGGKARVVDGVIYIGADPAKPAIGDHRISYGVAQPASISIVGRQSSTDFGAFKTKAGDSLLFVRPSVVPATEIFTDAQAHNHTLTWVLRIVGIVAMLIGFMLLASPLISVMDFIPIIGPIFAVGAAIVAIFLTAIIASIVIASAWLYYRPLLAMTLVGAGAGVAILVRIYASAGGSAAHTQPRATAAPAASRGQVHAA
jgi:hypothetical protein